MRGSRIAHHSAPLGADQSARGRDRAERRIVYSRWCRPLPMENENERSIIAAALDEALRDQVKRLFAVLAMLMVDDGGSNVARDKAENASPPDRWCPIARAATPSVRSDRRDLTRRGKWG